tara:strand:+ start:3429 stop:3740 length:312 start_codon:yes stop_codon:yes gene_type:complete
MIILEYLLDATDAGMKCPPWVDDGGYWGSTDHTLIGVTRNSPEFHIPSTVKRLTAAELETRQVAIHTANPLTKRGETPNDDRIVMTEAEVRTEIQNWVTLKGV